MRKSIIYLSILILITGLTVYCFNLNNRTSKFIGRDKLKLQHVSFPDIHDAEFIMYDIVNHADTTGYTSQYPYFYTQVYHISEEKQDSVKKDLYRIDMQWKSSELCENDSAIGFLWKEYTEPIKYFILTATDLDLRLPIWYSIALWGYFPETTDSIDFKDGKLSLVIGEPVRPNYDRDTTILISAILEQYTYPDKIETYYTLDGKRKVGFEITKYTTYQTVDAEN